MLDQIICSTSLHKRVKNCYVAPNGLESDHYAVRMQPNLTSLKYKEKASINGGITDWRKICKDDEQRKLYNKYLLEHTSHTMAYYDFCEAVARAGQETDTTIM